MRKLILFGFFFHLTFVLWAQDKLAASYSENIKAGTMRDILYKLASDEFEGRETAMPGQKLAAAYITEQFRSAGVAPKGDSAYYQFYPVEQSSFKGFNVSAGEVRFVPGVNCYAYPVDASTEVELSKMFIINPDSLEQLGEFPPNSIAVELIKEQKDVEFSLNQRHARQLKRLKPAMIIEVIESENRIVELYSRPRNSFIGLPADTSEKRVPVLVMSYKIFGELIKNAEQKRSLSKLKKLSAKNISIAYPLNVPLKVSVENNTRSLRAENVLCVIEGSNKKDEYIFVTAHYDHLGKRKSDIYYGADDDGSGTTAMIEIAKAFQKAKNEGHGPRRSIVCMGFSGEEKGLLGSAYFSNHPVVPIENIVADLNIDMIGRIDPKHEKDTNYIYLIGSGMLSSELKSLSESVNASGPGFILDYTYDDPKDPNRFYYRSDHYNFAKHNIPVIFYFNGVHADYHKPTDTPDKIHYELMAARARLVFQTAWELANKEERIVVDKQTDPK